ncbi:MAG: beta-ketoacyl synthase [Bacteroidetes bacterium]|jgi:3-oxoacyl-[acyl-carrier-protein] synthase-1|nr:beta-ketoacyl synthase [Bacteroidota bacterium]MBP7256299.1 beta-ketoacyl synthase [Chitinophagales bacterium]MBK7503908.1 beta-ketoacyl synthase [Bacteroidota bacterium]MBK7639006.1 beta-ketoacyl synthase [Bacteroidota bacterium]MBK8674022.1 beta-ketoacyl synthase [Bacteroidota bacterium]
MRHVFVVGHNIISPLGNTTDANFTAILNGNSGIQLHNRHEIDDESFYASLFNESFFLQSEDVLSNNYTPFEYLLIESIKQAIEKTEIDITNKDTIIIVSTTKGNINLLKKEKKRSDELVNRISLSQSAQLICNKFKNPNKPIVISNACISGVAAILYGKRILDLGHYKNAIIVGADCVGQFIFSGFKSFRALSDSMCKPFSIDRNGINLGEAVATIILTTQAQNNNNIEICSGAITNDANHISGPSRTGKELSKAIRLTLNASNLLSEDVDFISAHGTATIFNDEMEANAYHLSEMDNIPVNSLKAYFGHTLGASGILESVISILSLEKGVIIPTHGFTTHGTTNPINICEKPIYKPLNTFIKTASGFGGCNGSILFSKG